MSNIKTPDVYERGPEETLSQGVTLFSVGLPSDEPIPMPVSMAEFIVQPKSKTVPEDHGVRELWYVVEGQGELISGGQVTKLRAGQVAFMESRVSHCAANPFDRPLRIFACWWKV